MPTGSGKTAVIAAAPFLLEANRILILAPSRLVREQIVEDLTAFSTLKKLAVLPESLEPPRVWNAVHRVASIEDWEILRDFDIVVGTPASLSPGSFGIPDPPVDLFDVVLVDEAHHAPAATWAALLDHFRDARQILFTATPFRSDQQEIKGRFIYTYDLRQAYKDGIFGQLEYLPVVPTGRADPDTVLAKAAAATLLADRAAGLDHLLMVRSGSQKRATELKHLYEQHTTLRLALVTGNQTLAHVRKTLADLESDGLDGIICVDMLGEGFNLPRLKVAALHSPHKSLAITLQFIGRFARTTGPNLGRAAFHAIASEMSIEREYLYKEGAVWEELIPTLGADRVAAEQRAQEVLESFEGQPSDFADVPDLSLYSIQPYFHVKVLNTGPDVDLFGPIDMPGRGEVVYRYFSRAESTALYIVRQRNRPRWTDAAHLDAVAYELYVLHLDRASGYLFICASRRDEDVYQHFAKQFPAADGTVPRGLSSARLQGALRGLEDLRFFNIGMRNAASSDREASYHTMAGSAVDQALANDDGRRYHRGHSFAKAKEAGHDVTIGISTASKVWSNMSDRLPKLIGWCKALAQKLQSGTVAPTNTGIDLLSAGHEVDALPPDIIAVDWDKSVYTHPKEIVFPVAHGEPLRAQLLDVEFSVERSRTTDTSVGLLFTLDGNEYRANFGFDNERLIEPADAGAPEPAVVGDGTMPLTNYLNERYPALYTASFGYLRAGDYFDPPAETLPPFAADRLEAKDWLALGVDPKVEAGDPTPRGRSIHSWFEEDLRASPATVVFYDHGSGEVADFVTVTQMPDYLLVELIHCKSYKEAQPGARVDNLYELCGQAAKSKNWQSLPRLLQSIKDRARRDPDGHRFVKGSLGDLERLIGPGQLVDTRFRVTIVQPGLSRGAVNDRIGALLASADEFIFGGRWLRMRVMCSA
jgi:hypothetical protein